MIDKIQNIKNQVLKERAENLATPLDLALNKEETKNILLFTSMNTQFSIYLSTVEAVTRITNILTIPRTPKHIPGVIQYKGSTVALVNPRFFFYPTTEGLIDEDFAILVKAKNRLFALQVTNIEGVVPMILSKIKKIPDNYDSAIAPYLDGMTDDNTALLNIDKMVLSEGFGTTKIKD